MNGLPTLIAPRGPLAVQTRKSLSPESQSSALGTIQVVTPDGLNLLMADIDFGSTGANEIFQNVKFILLTEYFSVPLDRQFGMDFTMVDKPMQVAEAMLSQEVAMKVALYEPRCQFQEISFDGSAIGGKLAPTVVIEILAANELPSRYPSPAVPTTPAEVQMAQAYVYASEFPSFIDFLGSLTKGPEGPQGLAATVDCGETTTGLPGTQAEVENVGDNHNAVFEFTIPRGDQGSIGPHGSPAYTFSVADFTIPAEGETVVIEVEDAAWATVGEFLWVEGADGVEAGSLKIVEIVGNLITLENPRVSEGLVITYVAARTWNVIGNPNFEVDQRLNGEIQVAGNFVSDRWAVQGTPSLDNKWKAYVTQIPQVPSIVPGGRHRVSNKALAVQVLTPLTTLDRSDSLHIRTVVEGCQSRGIMEAESSLGLLVMLWNSDWYSTTPLKFGVTIRDCNQSNTLAKLCEVNGTAGSSTTAWTYIRLPKLPPLSETYDYISPGVVGYHVDICLSAGVDYIAPQNDIWLPSNYVGALGQDNFLESVRTLYVTFLQHEPGPYCTPFLEKDWLTNVEECYRYFNKSYDYATKPGIPGPGAWGHLSQVVNTGPPDWVCYGNVEFPRPMMIPPTMKVFHHSTGAANQALLQFTGFNAATTISGLWANERSIHTIKGPGSTSNPAHVLFHWTADTHY